MYWLVIIIGLLPARPAMVHHQFIQHAHEHITLVKLKPATPFDQPLTFAQRWHDVQKAFGGSE